MKIIKLKPRDFCLESDAALRKVGLNTIVACSTLRAGKMGVGKRCLPSSWIKEIVGPRVFFPWRQREPLYHFKCITVTWLLEFGNTFSLLFWLWQFGRLAGTQHPSHFLFVCPVKLENRKEVAIKEKKICLGYYHLIVTMVYGVTVMKYLGKIKYMCIQIINISISDIEQGYKCVDPVWLLDSC